MKFKDYLALIADNQGCIPTPRFRWELRTNQRSTAREEAIAAEVLRQANPRENLTGRFPWGQEEQMVLQQLWIKSPATAEWRDVPIDGARELYCVADTAHGPLPVPNAIREPGQVQGDLRQRVREILGEDSDD